MSADKILSLLATRHTDDVFVPECKDGPSQFTGHRRLDAWVMRKSWTNPQVTGYEIKVARDDYLNDDKWRAYLDCCNCFYFVCPWKMILPEELDDGVGLLWATSTGTRLVQKRKAKYRDVDIPESLFRYILMARVRVVKDGSGYEKGSETKYWQQWMERRDQDKELGWNVSRKIKELVNIRISLVKAENVRLKKENEKLTAIKGLLEQMSIPSYAWNFRDKFEKKVAVFRRGCPENLVADVNKAITSLQLVLKHVEDSGEDIDE